MQKQNRKIVLVGTGMVGMSYAYVLLNRNLCDELVLIDIDKNRAMGEAMDLNHGLAFSGRNMKIYAGEYEDCTDADLVVIAAGVAQKPGESRINLLNRNTQVFRSIVSPIVDSGFHGIFLIATNPVDIMTYVTYQLSGFAPQRVLGSGTALDTARLRYLLGSYFSVDPRNVHAYVMGEHGDSEFVPWSQAMIATKSVGNYCKDEGNRHCKEKMESIGIEVRDAAQKIIDAKKATYYGIGMALAKITGAILGDEQSVLTVSVLLEGQYGQSGVYVGVPSIVGREGIENIIELDLQKDEIEKLTNSCALLKSLYTELTI